MPKDPAVLFYVQDFLIGSSLLTPLQKGHYITLLCYQQQSETGSLTLEEIQSLMKNDFSKQWPVIKKKFKEDEKGFYNTRMRKEMERRRKSSLRQTEISLTRWDNRGNATGHTVANAMGYANGNAVGVPLLETATEIEKETKGNLENSKSEKRQILENASVTYDAEKTILENQIQFESICISTRKDSKEALFSLHKYHLFLEEKELYPKGRRAVFAGFEKWLLNEKNFKPPEAKARSEPANKIPSHLKSIK